MANESDLSTWKVLIVDDNADNLAIAEQLLSFHGAEVRTAQSGTEGLQVLEDLDPTFILLDLTMPELDGWEMLKRIRARPQTFSTPVIALTGHAMQEELMEIKAAGFNGYITKPYLMANFLKSIKETLAGPKSQPDEDQ
jgi:CheY-like chemotaxis protein